MRSYRRPVAADLSFEVGGDNDPLGRLFGSRLPQIVDLAGRDAVEQARSALMQERLARAAAEDRLASLAEATSNLRRLKLSAVLLGSSSSSARPGTSRPPGPDEQQFSTSLPPKSSRSPR